VILFLIVATGVFYAAKAQDLGARVHCGGELCRMVEQQGWTRNRQEGWIDAVRPRDGRLPASSDEVFLMPTAI